MRKNMSKIVLGLAMCGAFFFGISAVGNESVQAEDSVGIPSSEQAANVSGAAVQTTPTPTPPSTPTPTPVDVSKIKLNKTKGVFMAGKKVTLSITGTNSTVTWKSVNPKIATVSTKGVMKGVKKGKTVIEASVDGITLKCNVTIVPKMTKKDFGKFNGENFVSWCQRKGYNHGYAWNGQWKGGSKKKTTYRKIKIGASKTKVQNAYGELSIKKCTSKDPFTKMKGLKKNKVKTYADVVYASKYRIRFYFNKNNKVVAIIYACNIGKIKKSALKKYI